MNKDFVVTSSIPLWIKDHLSFRRDSVILSSCDMSGLILISFGSDLALDRNSDTSMVQFSSTSTGCGFACWSYFPSLSISLYHFLDVTWSKSWVSHLFLVVIKLHLSESNYQSVRRKFHWKDHCDCRHFGLFLWLTMQCCQGTMKVLWGCDILSQKINPKLFDTVLYVLYKWHQCGQLLHASLNKESSYICMIVTDHWCMHKEIPNYIP